MNKIEPIMPTLHIINEKHGIPVYNRNKRHGEPGVFQFMLDNEMAKSKEASERTRQQREDLRNQCRGYIKIEPPADWR